MAGEKLTDLMVTNLVTTLSSDALVCLANNPNTNPTTVVIKLSDFQNNLTTPIKSHTTPANSTSTTITQGSIFYDTNYGYIAVANNVMKRFSLSSF